MDKLTAPPAPCGAQPTRLWLTLLDGKPCAAYPRKVQAEVYGSGFSETAKLSMVEGDFYPLSATPSETECSQPKGRLDLAGKELAEVMAHPPASATPRVDREEYTVTERDIGFKVVNPGLARELERKLAEAQEAMRDASSKIHDADAGRINWRVDFAERIDAALKAKEGKNG